MFHLAGEALPEVALGKLVLQGGHCTPPPVVALLRRIGLLAAQLLVAEEPAKHRRRVAVTALARESLHLKKEKDWINRSRMNSGMIAKRNSSSGQDPFVGKMMPAGPTVYEVSGPPRKQEEMAL